MKNKENSITRNNIKKRKKKWMKNMERIEEIKQEKI